MLSFSLINLNPLLVYSKDDCSVTVSLQPSIRSTTCIEQKSKNSMTEIDLHASFFLLLFLFALYWISQIYVGKRRLSCKMFPGAKICGLRKKVSKLGRDLDDEHKLVQGNDNFPLWFDPFSGNNENMRKPFSIFRRKLQIVS